MRWTLFTLVLVAAYVLQTTLVPLFAPGWLDLLLVVTVVYGLKAPAEDARLAGWLIGFSRDIDTVGPVGLHALALGLAVYGLTLLRELVNLHLWWVRWLVAFLVAFPAQLFVRIYQHVVGITGNLSMLSLVTGALLTATVAALIATAVLALPGALRRRRRRAAAFKW